LTVFILSCFVPFEKPVFSVFEKPVWHILEKSIVTGWTVSAKAGRIIRLNSFGAPGN
jgi:hypothetical protein